MVIRPKSAGLPVRRSGFGQRLFFHGKVCIEIDLGRFHRFVPKPQGDHCGGALSASCSSSWVKTWTDGQVLARSKALEDEIRRCQSRLSLLQTAIAGGKKVHYQPGVFGLSRHDRRRRELPQGERRRGAPAYSPVMPGHAR